MRPQVPTLRTSLKAIPGGLFSARTPERAQSQVEKNGHDPGGDEKHVVIRPMCPTGSHAPQIWRKHDDRQKEEDSGDLKPHDAANTAKGFEKAAHATGHSATGLGHGSPRSTARGSGVNLIVYRVLRGTGWSGVHTGGKPLAYDTACNPRTDSQSPANSLWSHSVYDGSSDAG